MKFGVIMHKTTQNIGDDIQTYAAKYRLPSVDYFIDREKLDSFETPDKKPAAVVMSAWYMWHKWNWPPSKYVVPLMTGIHFSDHQASEQAGSPVGTEFIEGCGRDYMNAWGPIGCRDLYTLDKFTEIGINSFFSGCVTLTLPNQPRVEHEKEYICAVDLPASVLAKLKEILKDKDIDIVQTTHYKDYRNSTATWDEREQAVKELLTIYQNAKCVVTRRLHCALPCLAMGVPVFVTNRHKRPVSGRFDPYYDWISNCSYEEFLAGNFDYDFADPPKNDTAYLEVRNAMINAIDEFVKKYADENGDVQQYSKLQTDTEQFYKWKIAAMGGCMDKWLTITMNEENELKRLNKTALKYEEQTVKLKDTTQKLNESQEELDNAKAERDDLKIELDKAKKEIADMEKELDDKNTRLKNNDMTIERYEKILGCRSVRYAIKARNAFSPKNKKIKL